MNKSYTLRDIAAPDCPMKSTSKLAVSLPGQPAYSFSFPPILYYLLKAKTLCRLRVEDESDFEKKDNIKSQVINEIKDIAKSIFNDIRFLDDSEKELITPSTSIQSRILLRLLNESEENLSSLEKKPSVPINSTSSQKNVTIPHYLFSRLSKVLGDDKLARLHIHLKVSEIVEYTKKHNLLDEKGKIKGDAGNSSFSRKLNNALIVEMLEMSCIEELFKSPSILDVKMERDEKIEIK